MGRYYVTTFNNGYDKITENDFILKMESGNAYTLYVPKEKLDNGYRCNNLCSSFHHFSYNACKAFLNNINPESLHLYPLQDLTTRNISPNDMLSYFIISREKYDTSSSWYSDEFDIGVTIYYPINKGGSYKPVPIIISWASANTFTAKSDDPDYITTSYHRPSGADLMWFYSYDNCVTNCNKHNMNMPATDNEQQEIYEIADHIRDMIRFHYKDILNVIPKASMEDKSILSQAVLEAIKDYV